MGRWRALGRVDAFQQRHRVLAVPFAVHKRFLEDRGSHYSALISYYGFFSIFPLLLAFVSVMGLVLKNHPHLKQQLIDSAFGKFPVIGRDLSDNVKPVEGNIAAVVFGVVVALWAGLKALVAASFAMDTMWRVPVTELPSFFGRRWRGFLMLIVLGGGTIASTAIATVATQVGGLNYAGRLATAVGTIVVNAALLVVAYRVLTVASPPARTLLPGAVLGAVALFLVQVLGTWYVTSVVNDASDTYGTFAVVIGLLTWVSLQARIILYSAELNVVVSQGLWPRTFDRIDRYSPR